MIEQQEPETPRQEKPEPSEQNAPFQVADTAATPYQSPAGDGSVGASPPPKDPKPREGRQLQIAIPYLVALSASLGLAVAYAGSNFKISMTWLIIGVVSSQVVVDLAKFPSPESKAGYSAAYRILAGLAALAIVYLA